MFRNPLEQWMQKGANSWIDKQYEQIFGLDEVMDGRSWMYSCD